MNIAPEDLRCAKKGIFFFVKSKFHVHINLLKKSVLQPRSTMAEFKLDIRVPLQETNKLLKSAG